MRGNRGRQPWKMADRGESYRDTFLSERHGVGAYASKGSGFDMRPPGSPGGPRNGSQTPGQKANWGQKVGEIERQYRGQSGEYDDGETYYSYDIKPGNSHVEYEKDGKTYEYDSDDNRLNIYDVRTGESLYSGEARRGGGRGGSGGNGSGGGGSSGIIDTESDSPDFETDTSSTWEPTTGANNPWLDNGTTDTPQAENGGDRHNTTTNGNWEEEDDWLNPTYAPPNTYGRQYTASGQPIAGSASYA